MSNRYEYYFGTMSIKDNETNKVYDYVADLLNEQDQKIKDLEHRLSNCIEPKFKKGDKCYFMWGRDIGEITITDVNYHYSVIDPNGFTSTFPPQQIFATEEEAKKKLEERVWEIN